MRITIPDYMMERDTLYPGECTVIVKGNAEQLVQKINALLAALEASNVPLEEHPKNGSIVSSGWRPPQINGQVKGAAPRSKHMTGQACDLYDPEGAIDDWCMEHPEALEAIGLWMEHPSATKGWAHFQTIPPRSGRRVFYP